MSPTFSPLPAVPDHSALEREILAWWDRERIFEQLRDQNRGGERWHFLDGPITANNPMGIHHAWGRTLKDVFQRYKGHRSTPWCPRCGTSISQHELFAGEYKELEHPSLFVRFPLKGRNGEALVIWTTTPWTLPANVAAAVRPDVEY